MGGLPRRAAFINQEITGDLKAVILDSGNFISSRPLNESVLESAKAKAELILRSMDHMGYTALAIGEMDLYLGLERLRSLRDMTDIQFLSANLADSDGKLLFKSSTVLKMGNIKVGVIGLTAPPADKRVLDKHMDGASVRDPFAAARETVDNIRKKCDLLVVLSNITYEKNMELAEAVPGIDIIISGRTKRFMKRPVIKNATLITAGYYEGRAVGKLIVRLDDEVRGWISNHELDYLDKQIKTAETKTGTPAGQRRYDDLTEKRALAGLLTVYEPDMVNLTPSFPDDPDIASMISEYREKLKKDSGSGPGQPAVRGEQVHYTGSEPCARCHEARYRFWLTTGHSRAFDSLAPKNAEADPDCIPCHVTGYMRRTGYWPKAPKENLRGIQCEACHGVGSLHAASPESYSLIHLPLAPRCMDCHTEDQDDDFDYMRDKVLVCSEGQKL